jgi:hypothetical protein
MDLLLHVGLHKTATTSVQACLKASAEVLRDHGILYPSTGLWDAQHALIPCCLLAEHAVLDSSVCASSLDDYLGSLQLEYDEFCPSLVVISSEVFTEITCDREGCLWLIKELSHPFSRVTILLSLREPMAMALSSLKHMLRENFYGSTSIFSDAFFNPVATFYQVACGSEAASRFWRESGIPVYERHMEGAYGSLADHYFGDIFDQYNSDARVLLCPESNPRINSFLHLNSDKLTPVTYLVLFLLGNSVDSAIFADLNTPAIILEECQVLLFGSGLSDSLNNNQLLGYFDFFSAGDPATLQQYIPISQKLNALTHAGLKSSEILDLFTVVHRVKLRFGIA